MAVAQSRMSSVATAARPKPARLMATKLAFDRFQTWIRGEQRLASVVWTLRTDDVQRRLMTKGQFPLLQLIGFLDAVFLFCSAARVLEWPSQFLAQDWQTERKATSRLWRFRLHALLVKIHAKASLLLVMSRISPPPPERWLVCLTLRGLAESSAVSMQIGTCELMHTSNCTTQCVTTTWSHSTSSHGRERRLADHQTVNSQDHAKCKCALGSATVPSSYYEYPISQSPTSCIRQFIS